MEGVEPKLFELSEQYGEQIFSILKRKPSHFRRNGHMIINCYETETLAEAECLAATIRDQLKPNLDWSRRNYNGFCCSPGVMKGEHQNLVISLVWGKAEFRGKNVTELSILLTIGDGPLKWINKLPD